MTSPTKQVAKLRSIIERQFKVEGDLRREVGLAIKRLMDLWVAIVVCAIRRFARRGQRTRSNARIRKGRVRQSRIRRKPSKGNVTWLTQSKLQEQLPLQRRKLSAMFRGPLLHSAGFGNTIVTFTDLNGTLCAGRALYVGISKEAAKGRHLRLRFAADDAGKKAVEAGMKSIDVVVTGPGAGREPPFAPWPRWVCE